MYRTVVTGSFLTSMDFSLSSMYIAASKLISVPSASLWSILINSGHLISVAERVRKNVGKPICLIKANRVFFLDSQNAGEDLTCCKTRNPSSNLIASEMNESDVASPAFIFVFVLIFLRQTLTLPMTLRSSFCFAMKRILRGTHARRSLLRHSDFTL
uniref:Uncharacterized protein n=1 Tax=Cacopsylla melanoneura TaxID=428564 RepID=A0A8D8X1S0_9HEMI